MAGADVAQQLHPRLDDVGQRPERLHVADAVIGGSGSVRPGNLPLAVQSNLPPSTMTPPMEVPWPPMNLVAECTTMSAPCSMGVTDTGVAKVLSTISGMPASWAISATALDIEHVERGIADRLGVERRGLRGDGRAEVLGIARDRRSAR